MASPDSEDFVTQRDLDAARDALHQEYDERDMDEMSREVAHHTVEEFYRRLTRDDYRPDPDHDE